MVGYTARMLGHETTLVVLAVEPEDMNSIDLDLAAGTGLGVH